MEEGGGGLGEFSYTWEHPSVNKRDMLNEEEGMTLEEAEKICAIINEALLLEPEQLPIYFRNELNLGFSDFWWRVDNWGNYHVKKSNRNNWGSMHQDKPMKKIDKGEKRGWTQGLR
jgi:hypothetical protein